MRSTKCAECLSLDILHSSCVRIVFLFSLAEEPVHSIGDAWSDVYILECREVRQTDLEIMGHTVLELVPESRLVEFRSLEVDLVLEAGVITKGEFLIKFLLPK